MSKLLSIYIVDDHPIFCIALKHILEHTDEVSLRLVKSFYNGKDFMNSLEAETPDLVLLDLNLPDIHGVDIIQEVQKKNRSINIIVLTSYSQEKLVKDCMQNGAAGYVLKNNTFEELIEAIQAVDGGESYLGKGVRLFKRDFDIQNENSFDLQGDAFHLANKLTKREKEILNLIVDAKTNKQIANQLYISDQTVGVHRKNIMRKLAVNNTASLIKKALELQMGKF